MNCQSFRKYVGAFADGELDTDLSLQALEHLNMCPSCAQRIAEVEAIKASLRRIWSQERAPDSLRTRIEVALRGTSPASPIEADASSPVAPRRFRLAAPLAAAATLVLGVAIWQLAVAPPAAGLPAALAAAVRAQHRDCIAMGDKHHDPTLARTCEAIRDGLGQRLALDVAAPDLADLGCDLVGADECGVRGRKGAHVLYRGRETGAYLSLFTLARLSDLAGADARAGRAFLRNEAEGSSIVAWQGSDASYILCGELPCDRLIELARPIRTAAIDPGRPVRLASR